MFILGISLLFLLDQLTKYFIRAHLHLFESIPLIPRILYLTHTQNTGGVFGILPDQTNFFIIGTILVLFLLFLSFFFLEYSSLQRLALILVIAGALGNLFDRIYFGYVTDFLDIQVWPIFNLADTYVVIGVGLFLIHEFLQYLKDRGA